MIEQIQQLKQKAIKMFDAQYDLMETAGLSTNIKKFAQEENRKQKLQVIETLNKMENNYKVIENLVEKFEVIKDNPIQSLE